MRANWNSFLSRVQYITYMAKNNLLCELRNQSFEMIKEKGKKSGPCEGSSKIFRDLGKRLPNQCLCFRCWRAWVNTLLVLRRPRLVIHIGVRGVTKWCPGQPGKGRIFRVLREHLHNAGQPLLANQGRLQIYLENHFMKLSAWKESQAFLLELLKKKYCFCHEETCLKSSAGIHYPKGNSVVSKPKHQPRQAGEWVEQALLGASQANAF